MNSAYTNDPTVLIGDNRDETRVPDYSRTRPRVNKKAAYLTGDDDDDSDQGNLEIVRPVVKNHLLGDVEEISLLQKLEGFVTEVGDDSFRARFTRFDPPSVEAGLEAEFLKAELVEADISILDVGMPLVWSIIYERRKGGIHRTSILYLRRISRPEPEEIEEAKLALDEWIGSSAEQTS